MRGLANREIVNLGWPQHWSPEVIEQVKVDLEILEATRR
jgi:hypothetical protein